MEAIMEFKFDPIEEIVEEIRQGHIVIMQDPADREKGQQIYWKIPESDRNW